MRVKVLTGQWRAMTQLRSTSSRATARHGGRDHGKSNTTDSLVQTTVNGIQYVLHMHVLDPREVSKSSQPSLLTVLSHNAEVFSLSDLQDFLTRARDEDDVFQSTFLQTVVFVSDRTHRPLTLGKGVEELLHSLHNRRIDFLTAGDIAPYALPSGPYASYNGSLWQPWRIYHDTQSAFMVALEPHTVPGSGLIAHVPVATPFLGIPVASRLYTDHTPERPLAAVRVAVKDAFDIKGVKTTLSSKAYADLYHERDCTAAAITALIRKGGVIVGKTRLNSLISKEDPTEAVDYSAPFNPRGDGYQSPAGSSSGSAAAIGAYDWLDVAVGTDTNGSGRIPAIVNGCFSLRITHGALGSEGLVPSFSYFDAPCLFARDIEMLRRVTEAWLADGNDRASTGSHSFPNRIVWLTDFLHVDDAPQRKLIESFVSDLESTLGVTRTQVSLFDTWGSIPPKEAGTDSIRDYLDEPGWTPVFYDAYHNYDDFRRDYQQKFDKQPFVTPYNRWKWSVGAKVSRERRDKGIARLAVYKTWLLDEILRTADSNTILILSNDDGRPNYRDTQPSPGTLRNAYSSLYVSPVLGAPEMSVAIGQVPYESVISGRTEQRPIGLSLVAAPGRDLALVELVQRTFRCSGRPSKVLTGSCMY